MAWNKYSDQFKKIFSLISGIILCMVLVSCAADDHKTDEVITDENTDGRIVVGFSQVGAESDWRNANTLSMMEAFSASPKFTLIYEDGQQKQSNQIMAIRIFIHQEVDYIVLAPVTEKGWDTVLQEAKEAGIPVIIVDREVDVADESLFTCFIGSDFELEGRKATEWLHLYCEQNSISPESINIVGIQGTIGATAQIGRTKGLTDASKKYGWNLLAMESGDFTQTKGKEVMEKFLSLYDNINVVYCENDNEALGAIEAIEAAGKTVGSDINGGEIMVISFDGVGEQALEYIKQGRISVTAECNPHHGPRVMNILEALETGDTPLKSSYVEEKIFSANDAITAVAVDGREYDVTILK